MSGRPSRPNRGGRGGGGGGGQEAHELDEIEAGQEALDLLPPTRPSPPATPQNAGQQQPQQQQQPSPTPPPKATPSPSPPAPPPQFDLERLKTLSRAEAALSQQITEFSSQLANFVQAINRKVKASHARGVSTGQQRPPPAISVSSILDEGRQEAADYVAALKPLFKEWLELRDDYHDTLGPYLMLPALEADRLLVRIRHLRRYLSEQVPAASAPGLPERLRDFHVWMKDQVKAVEGAIKRADPKRVAERFGGGSGGGGGGGGGGSPPKPPGPPSQPQQQQQQQQQHHQSRKVYRATAVATKPADKKSAKKT